MLALCLRFRFLEFPYAFLYTVLQNNLKALMENGKKSILLIVEYYGLIAWRVFIFYCVFIEIQKELYRFLFILLLGPLLFKFGFDLKCLHTNVNFSTAACNDDCYCVIKNTGMVLTTNSYFNANMFYSCYCAN